LLQLDYELRPSLWIECGETPAAKLDKLAVKAPFAEIWVVLESLEKLEALRYEMARLHLRKNRYRLLCFEETMIEEMLSLFAHRNELNLFRLSIDEPQIQFEFNGIWFDAPFGVLSV
jgi:hypothetical protein